MIDCKRALCKKTLIWIGKGYLSKEVRDCTYYLNEMMECWTSRHFPQVEEKGELGSHEVLGHSFASIAAFLNQTCQASSSCFFSIIVTANLADGILIF